MLKLDPALLAFPGSERMARAMRRALKPRPNLLVWQWADRKRRLNRKHAKRAGRWRTDAVPFMREPMAMMSARSQVQRGDIMKGAQVSGTETGLNLVGYTIQFNPGPLMFVSPSLTVAKRTAARVQAMIDDDPKGLGRLILPARAKGATNSQLEKHFPGGALYFATAKSAANLRSTAVETLILDELEAYPRDVEEEGQTEDVAEARGDSMGDSFKVLAISTPAVDQTSLIRPAYQAGDQRCYFMRCPHADCNRLINFQKENIAWDVGRPETAHYICQCCSKKIEERHKTRMMADGIWIPKFLRTDPAEMARIEGGDTSVLDVHNLTVKRVSWHLPSFYSPLGWLSWAKIAARWDAAEGIPSKMKVIVNTIFGETWMEAGEAPAWESVYARRNLSYQSRKVPKDVLFLAAGADVGIDHVEVSVWGFGRRRRRYLIEHLRVEGAYNEPETWAQVTAITQRKYLHPCGAVLPIRRLGIDRRTFDAVVDPWVMEQSPRQVLAVQGSDYLDTFFRWSKRKEKPTADTTAPSARFDFLTVGSSFAKLDLYSNLNLRLVEGATELPAGWVSLPSDVSQDYVKQLVSERLTFVDKKGQTRSGKGKWVGVGSTRHEALDCAVYARAMANLIGWDRWSEKDYEREEKALYAAAADLAAQQDLADRDSVEEPVPIVISGVVLPVTVEDTMSPEDAEEEGAPETVRRIDIDAHAKTKGVAIEHGPGIVLHDPAAPRPSRWGRKGERQAGVVGCSGRKPSWREKLLRTSHPADDDD